MDTGEPGEYSRRFDQTHKILVTMPVFARLTSLRTASCKRFTVLYLIAINEHVATYLKY